MQFRGSEDSHAFGTLTEPGRVVVSAMRHAPSGTAATLSCFADTFGEKGGRACFVVFLQILHAFALHGRRRVRVGTVGWPILTHDEVAFLQCVDAAVRGHEAACDAHSAWLVRSCGAREFAGYVRTLACLMPEPLYREPPAAGRPPRREDAGAATGAATQRPGPDGWRRPFPRRANSRATAAFGYFRFRSQSLKILSQACSAASGA